MTRKYRAFISYSWADKAWGERLHRALETYRTPAGLIGKETALGPVPARLHPIFKDREEEAAGHSIGASIEAAMRDSEFLIVICSPRSAQSKWVNREVAFFKKNRDSTRILAVIVDGEPGASAIAGREAEECFPRTLTRKVGDDLQPTDEAEDAPLAADARESGDGARGAKLKLAAAMLGLGLDDLVRRDERRRAIRRRFVLAASLALAAVLGGLSIFAFNQRDAAVLARNEAVAARGLAEAAEAKAVKARDDAEGLIELILTDLKSDLEGYGTLKSVTQIGNRAIGYYEGQDVKALTPDQLGRRARVLLMLGEADNKRGDLSAALARYEAAAATTSEQLARDRDNAQRIFDHAQSVFWVGYIAWQRGDHAKAKEQFTEYHRHAARLVEIDPEKEDWQAELEYAYSNLGTLAMDAGDAAEAEGWFRKSLEISSRLLEKRPDDIDRVLAAGQSYAWLADASYLQARVADAATLRASQLEVYSTALRQDAGDIRILRAAEVARLSLAIAELGRNRIDIALSHATQASANLEEILAADPDNSIHAEQAAYSYVVSSLIQFYAGDMRSARSSLARTYEVSAKFLSDRSGPINWRGSILAQAKLINAEIAALSDANAAIEIADGLIDELASLIAAGRADRDILRRYGNALHIRARIDPSRNDYWDQIVTSLEPGEKIHVPEALTTLAEAYFRTGKASRAYAIVERLHDADYRHPAFMTMLAAYPELKAAAERRIR